MNLLAYVILLTVSLAASIGGLVLRDVRAFYATLVVALVLLVMLLMRHGAF